VTLSWSVTAPGVSSYISELIVSILSQFFSCSLGGLDKM
jgi:hypothetical protein